MEKQDEGVGDLTLKTIVVGNHLHLLLRGDFDFLKRRVNARAAELDAQDDANTWDYIKSLEHRIKVLEGHVDVSEGRE